MMNSIILDNITFIDEEHLTNVNLVSLDFSYHREDGQVSLFM